MMRDLVIQRLTKELTIKFGNSINTRGIIIHPKSSDSRTGTVKFNILDKSDERYGVNVFNYRMKLNEEIELIEIENKGDIP